MTSSILEVLVKVAITVQVRHRLFQMIHDVSNVRDVVLIACCIELIIEEFVVPRAGSRMRHFELLKSAVDIGVV